MPSNGPAEKIMYELKGIPLFTYGMIGITTLVLAYVTFTDVEKSTDNVENQLNPLSQLSTALSNQVSDMSKEASNIYQNMDVSKTMSNVYQNNPLSKAVSNVYQNSDLSKTVSNVHQTNPSSKEGEEKYEGQIDKEKEKEKGQRGGKTEKQTTKTKKQKKKTKKHKSDK